MSSGHLINSNGGIAINSFSSMIGLQNEAYAIDKTGSLKGKSNNNYLDPEEFVQKMQQTSTYDLKKIFNYLYISANHGPKVSKEYFKRVVDVFYQKINKGQDLKDCLFSMLDEVPDLAGHIANLDTDKAIMVLSVLDEFGFGRQGFILQIMKEQYSAKFDILTKSASFPKQWLPSQKMEVAFTNNGSFETLHELNLILSIDNIFATRKNITKDPLYDKLSSEPEIKLHGGDPIAQLARLAEIPENKRTSEMIKYIELLEGQISSDREKKTYTRLTDLLPIHNKYYQGEIGDSPTPLRLRHTVKLNLQDSSLAFVYDEQTKKTDKAINVRLNQTRTDRFSQPLKTYTNCSKITNYKGSTYLNYEIVIEQGLITKDNELLINSTVDLADKIAKANPSLTSVIINDVVVLFKGPKFGIDYLRGTSSKEKSRVEKNPLILGNIRIDKKVVLDENRCKLVVELIKKYGLVKGHLKDNDRLNSSTYQAKTMQGRATMHRNIGEYEQALSWYNEALKLSTNGSKTFAYTKWGIAKTNMLKGEAGKAFANFKEYLTISSEDNETLFYFAACQLKLNKNQEAINTLKKITDNYFDTKLLLAIAYLRNNKPDKARETIKTFYNTSIEIPKGGRHSNYRDISLDLEGYKLSEDKNSIIISKGQPMSTDDKDALLRFGQSFFVHADHPTQRNRYNRNVNLVHQFHTRDIKEWAHRVATMDTFKFIKVTTNEIQSLVGKSTGLSVDSFAMPKGIKTVVPYNFNF